MADWGFWLAAGGITLATFVLLVQALRGRTPLPDDGASLRVYRDQLTEVDRDLARGLISAPEADRVRTEVSRRLLDADRVVQGAPGARTAATYGPAVALIGVALLAAIGGYFWLGAPGYPDLPLARRLELAEQTYQTRPLQAAAEAAAPPEAVAKFDPEYQNLMDALRIAVAQRPDDVQGLVLLSRNETLMGNFKAARAAQQNLVTVLGDKATAADHLALAQAMIAAAAGYVSPEAEAALIRALELDPENQLARYFSGLMFAQNGRPDRTFALWQPLLAEGPAEASWFAPVQDALPDVAERAGINYRPADVEGPSAADMAAADEMTPLQRQDMVRGMVAQLETRLKDEGGPLADWLQLINATAVMGAPDRTRAAVLAATTVFAGDAAALTAIADAADAAGIAP